MHVEIAKKAQAYQNLPQVCIINASSQLFSDSKDYQNKLKELSKNQLTSFIKEWQAYLKKPDSMQNMENALMHQAVSQIKSSNTKIDTKIKGFVAVGNAHVINVDVNLFPQNQLSSYVEKTHSNISNDTDIQAEVKGFVAVYTIDIVNVNLNVGQAMGAASFFESMRKIQ